MNWTSTIAELVAAGMSQPQIATHCGCAQSTISGLATGQTNEPRHSLGEKLLKLLADKRAELVKREGGADASGAQPAQPMPAADDAAGRSAGGVCADVSHATHCAAPVTNFPLPKERSFSNANT